MVAAVETRIRLDIPSAVTVSRDLGLNSVTTLVCVQNRWAAASHIVLRLPSHFTTVLRVQKYVPRAARTFRAQISDFSDFDDDVKMFR